MLAKNPSLAEDLIYQGVAPTGAEKPDSDIQNKMARYMPWRSIDESWIYSEQRDLLKQSSAINFDFKLPRNTMELPLLTKIASYGYASYIASLLDQEENPRYTKLAALKSEQSRGFRLAKCRPWVVPTVLSLNHTFYC